jgi:hypothetical protein
MMELPSFMGVPSRIIQTADFEVLRACNPTALNVQDEGFIRAHIPDTGQPEVRY